MMSNGNMKILIDPRPFRYGDSGREPNQTLYLGVIMLSFLSCSREPIDLRYPCMIDIPDPCPKQIE